MSDNAPIQVGQFESNDELMDKWLTEVFLEGNGGGNDGESYMLAWYVAAFHTAIDCMEKRNQKGFLITIGDEACHPDIHASTLHALFGENFFKHCSAEVSRFMSTFLYQEACKKYNVFHINIGETSEGARRHTVENWKEAIGDHLRLAVHHADVPDIIADIVTEGIGIPITSEEKSTESEPESIEPEKDEEMML